MSVSRRLFSEGRQASSLLIITIGLGLVSGLFIVWQSRLISQIINAAFLEGQTGGGLGHLFVACLAMTGLRAVFTWLGEVSAHQAAQRIMLRLRRDLFNHLLKIGPAILLEAEDQEGRTGELVNTAMHGVESLEAYFSQYLPQLALAALVPISYLLFITPLDPLTGVILLLTAPLLPVFMYLIGNAARKQTRHQWLQLSRMSAYFLEVLQGLRTLKALGRSREQSGLIDQVSENHREITMSVLRVTFLSALALELVATLSTAVVAVEIGLRLLYGRLGFEQAFFILLLAPEFYQPLRLLGLRFHAGMAGIEAARRIYELFDIPAPTHPMELAREAPAASIPPEINFEEISFTYKDGRTGLDRVNLKIPAGKVTLLAGESGSGKSTVLALLLRFMQPQSGSIRVDDQPISEITTQCWINRLAWVPQNPYLFQDSLAANISLGRPGASLEQIQHAARLAHADEFIHALPEKYATQIGERGLRLSSGQAQRIALARAFLQDAPLLLLDEPGAHLDPETDAALYDSLSQLVQGRTVLMVSHKSVAALPVDQVVWLEAGKVKAVETSPRQAKKTASSTFTPLQSPSSPEIILIPQSRQQEPPFTKPFSLPTLLRLLRLLSPFKWRAALSVLLGSITMGSSMGLMTTAAYLISAAALQPSVAELQVAIVGVRFFGLARGIFRYLERLVTHDVTFRLLGKWRGWFFRAIEPLVPAQVQDKHSGDLLQRAIGDVSALEDFYVRGIAPPVVAFLTGSTACLFLSAFSLPLALFQAGVLLLSGVALPTILWMLGKTPGQRLVSAHASLNQALVDGIQGMPDLLASGQGDNHLGKIVAQTLAVNKIQTKLAVLTGLQVSSSRWLADLGMLGVLWLGVQQVSLGELEGVVLGALAMLAFSSFEPFLPLPQAAQHLSTSLTAAARLFEIADTRPQVKDPPDPQPVPGQFNLEVRDCSFRYPGQPSNVLAGITFSLPAGRKVALVGTSGAGKSSLLNLLIHFWDCTDGTIQLNGHALGAYSGDGLRKQIATLPQNPAIFSGSIFDNIRLKFPQATQDMIEKAACRANIHHWIQSLPDGYQTWVGENGLKLSGGQRQRIALARILVQETPLLLLDEPTAHLDHASEQGVISSILETVQANHSSLLLVTHRLVGMEKMDEILVLDHGHITEQGQHSELIQQGGLYARLWALQNR